MREGRAARPSVDEGRGRGLAVVAVAVAVQSLAGYVLLVLVGRALGPDVYGSFVAFWGVLFGLGNSVATLEQEAARRTAEGRLGRSPALGAVVLTAAVLVGGIGALTVIPAIAGRLYPGAPPSLGLVVVFAVVGFAVLYAVRGNLIGAAKAGAYAGLLVSEAGLRLVALGVVALAIGTTLESAAVAVGVGSFVWLGFTRRTRDLLGSPSRLVVDIPSAVPRAVGLIVGAALSAAVITGFPAVATVLTDGGAGAQSGVLFAALTLSRVPLLAVAPLQALTVPQVVRWRAAERAGTRSPIRRVLGLGLLAACVVAAVAAGVGALIGPWLVRLFYGPAYDVPGAVIAMLLVSACLLAWMQLLSAGLIGLSAHRRMVVVWLVAFGAMVLVLSASPWGFTTSVVAGALAAPVAGIAVAMPAISHVLRGGRTATVDQM